MNTCECKGPALVLTPSRLPIPKARFRPLPRSRAGSSLDVATQKRAESAMTLSRDLPDDPPPPGSLEMTYSRGVFATELGPSSGQCVLQPPPPLLPILNPPFLLRHPP